MSVILIFVFYLLGKEIFVFLGIRNWFYGKKLWTNGGCQAGTDFTIRRRLKMMERICQGGDWTLKKGLPRRELGFEKKVCQGGNWDLKKKFAKAGIGLRKKVCQGGNWALKKFAKAGIGL